MGIFDDLPDIQQQQPDKQENVFGDLPDKEPIVGPRAIFSEAAKNVPHSAVEFGKNIVQPFIHPVETATALKNLGQGILQKTGLMSGEEAVPYADAVGQFLVDRYGSLEAVKNTFMTDPVGIAADVSMVLTGGSSAAARAPGVVGQVGRVVQPIARSIDPLTVAGAVAAPVAKGIGTAASEFVGGLGTHTGGQALRTAAEAGYEGGEAAKALREGMRRTAPMEEVVQDAKDALSQIKQEKNAQYQAGMAAVGKNATPLSYDRIDEALAHIANVGTFKGKVIAKGTSEIRQEIAQAVQEWRMLPPEYQTAAGFDALKQQIYDISQDAKYGSRERHVADTVTNAIRKTIIAEEPQYAKVMKGYELASKQLRELEKALSLGEKSSADTALRKLQSVLRNNVHSNYGNRQALAAYLAGHGAPQLMEKLAGQSLSAWMPRGLGKLAVSSQLPLAAYLGASAPVIAAALPMMSPRLMGELAYYGGRAARGATEAAKPLRPAVRPAYQAGRAAEESEEGMKRGGGDIGEEVEEERRSSKDIPDPVPTPTHTFQERWEGAPPEPRPDPIQERLQYEKGYRTLRPGQRTWPHGNVVMASGGAVPSENSHPARGAKVSQRSVDYSPGMKSSHCGPTKAWPTGDCVHFQAPHGCSEVRGVIAPRGWCKLWKGKS